eukprot:327749_1
MDDKEMLLEESDETNITNKASNSELIDAISKAIAEAIINAKKTNETVKSERTSQWDGDSNGRWNLKADDHESVYNNLKYRFETIATLSGFIGGFTYIVGNNGVEFNDSVAVFISNSVRTEIFGALVCSSFALSMCAALLSSSYLLFIGMAGEENSKWFVQKFYFENKKIGIRMLDIPWYLFVLGLLTMFISTIVSIGGFYKTAVFVISLLWLVFLAYIWGSIYWKMRRLVWQKHAAKE